MRKMGEHLRSYTQVSKIILSDEEKRKSRTSENFKLSNICLDK